MAPKDLSYNVPDVLPGNYIRIQEDQIEIQYLPPGLSLEELNHEMDELISISLNSNSKYIQIFHFKNFFKTLSITSSKTSCHILTYNKNTYFIYELFYKKKLSHIIIMKLF